jgi:hypothetical protein
MREYRHNHLKLCVNLTLDRPQHQADNNPRVLSAPTRSHGFDDLRCASAGGGALLLLLLLPPPLLPLLLLPPLLLLDCASMPATISLFDACAMVQPIWVCMLAGGKRCSCRQPARTSAKGMRGGGQTCAANTYAFPLYFHSYEVYIRGDVVTPRDGPRAAPPPPHVQPPLLVNLLAVVTESRAFHHHERIASIRLR